MSFKRPVCLYFLAGSNPTEDEWAAAEELRARFDVKFRNAAFADGSRENCDAVAGRVPPEHAGTPLAADFAPPRKTLAKTAKEAKPAETGTLDGAKPAGWGAPTK